MIGNANENKREVTLFLLCTSWVTTETHILASLYKATKQGNKSLHKRGNGELIAFQISMANKKKTTKKMSWIVLFRHWAGKENGEFAARATISETWEQRMDSGFQWGEGRVRKVGVAFVIDIMEQREALWKERRRGEWREAIVIVLLLVLLLRLFVHLNRSNKQRERDFFYGEFAPLMPDALMTGFTIVEKKTT